MPLPIIGGGIAVFLGVLWLASAGRARPNAAQPNPPDAPAANSAAPPPPPEFPVGVPSAPSAPSVLGSESASGDSKPSELASPAGTTVASEEAPPLKLRRKRAKKTAGPDTKAAEALALKQMQSFNRAMAGKDDKQARASLDATFANKYDAETIFGSTSEAVWKVLEPLEQQIFEDRDENIKSLERLVKNPKLMTARNARSNRESEDEQAVLSMIRADLPVVEITARSEGQPDVMMVFVALNEKTVRALPPLRVLADELRAKNALVSASKDTATPDSEPELPPVAVAPFEAEAARQHQEAWSAYLNAPVEYVNPLGMKFVLIPPGEYLRGSPDSDSMANPVEKPQHRVRISHPFYLATTEVTQKQYREITGQTPSFFRTGGGGEARARGIDLSDRPVDTVSWVKAAQFCEMLQKKHPADVGGVEWSGYRLPSEAEWEYACRAGTETRWSFGDDPATVASSIVAGLESLKAVPPAVGGLPANAFGLHDMHGSVYEWCADAFDGKAYEPFRTEVAINPFVPPAGNTRVARGSSWDIVLTQSRAAGRLSLGQHDEGQSTGFRVAFGLADAPYRYQIPTK
ncbi:MAG: formylglycine-generating enzyme family protein [Planctomycetaceae bacterium]|nr:formylglycine-generating enzyme family protein [Planctomycetaceae bacterium]